MKRLAELRKERHISQAELAEVLNISQQAICKYELGQSEPDIYTLKGLANYFHTTIDYLVDCNSGNSGSDESDMVIDNAPVTRLEIDHLIAYRKLSDTYKEHVDVIINDLNQS